jgi:hypothetical protein
MRRTLPLIAAAAALAVAGCSSADDPAELAVSTAGWSTDFSKHTVPLDEFESGGPPKDGIPAIDEPKFESVGSADRFLERREPVAVLRIGDRARAYPIQILVWHEIVNDTLGGTPVTVTYCPLCNSTVTFDRRLGGRTLDFGTTGNLRRSDLVMYDRQTETWWQQITAEGVVGELSGEKLTILPSQILAWSEFRRAHPGGEVLSRDTGFDRDYGQSPYVGYDRGGAPMFGVGRINDALPAKARVTSIRVGDGVVVYPFSRLRRQAPVNDEIEGRPVVVFFDPSVRSALDAAAISEGRKVGAGSVFERRLDDRMLSFRPGPRAGTFRDRETGSVWNSSGEAVAGRLEGGRLRQLASDDEFWFAVAAFFERPEIRDGRS